jgi:hypothetical protein
MTSIVIARAQLKKAKEIIELGENRAMAAEGNVGHCRECLSNREFDEMWGYIAIAMKALGNAPLPSIRGAVLKKSINHSILNDHDRRKK